MKKILLLIIAAVMSFQSIFAQEEFLDFDPSIAEDYGYKIQPSISIDVVSVLTCVVMILMIVMPGCVLYKVVMQAITKKEVSFFKCLFKTLLTIIVTILVVAILGFILEALNK
jgi:hypothetical protein